MRHPLGNRGREFWERPKIIGAQRAVDVWASIEHHRLAGCEGVPTMPWLDERDHMVMRLVRRPRDKASQKLAGVSSRKPELEMFTGDKREFDKLAGRGEAYSVETSLPSAAPLGGKLTTAHLLYLAVGECLVEMGSPIGLWGLLLHRYPRQGPYERSESEASYRRYRPALIVSLYGDLHSRYLGWRLDELLGTMERDFLTELSLRGVDRGGEDR